MRKYWLLLTGLLLLAGGRTLAQPIPDEALLRDFEAYIHTALEQFDIPGAAVAIVYDDRVIYAQGFGLRSLESREPVTTETLFRAGSTTKAMTALLLATLVDDGLLDWEQPVRELLPEFALASAEQAAALRLRDLLNMGAGVDTDPFAWFFSSELTEQSLQAALAQRPLFAGPGEQFRYHNELYALGGHIGAKAAQSRYADLMRIHVFDPIGMSRTMIADDPATAGDDFAAAYSPNFSTGDHEPVASVPIGALSPAAGAVSNVHDLAQFLLLMLNDGIKADGTRLVTTQNLRETWREQTPLADPIMQGMLAGQTATYGMGWFVETLNGVQIASHSGNIYGYSAEMAFVPRADIGIVILNNSGFGAHFNSAVKYSLLERLYGWQSRASDSMTGGYIQMMEQIGGLSMLPATVDSADAQPMLGAYERGVSVEQRADDTLWVGFGGLDLQIAAVPFSDYYIVVNSLLVGAEVRYDEVSGTLSIRVGGTKPTELVLGRVNEG